jgi:hypothetical protein
MRALKFSKQEKCLDGLSDKRGEMSRAGDR